MTPEQYDRLARRGGVVQGVDDQVCIDGSTAAAPPGAAAGAVMKREVGEDYDGLAVIYRIEVVGQLISLSLSVIITAARPIVGTQSIDPEVTAVRALRAYKIIGSDGVGGGGVIAVVVLMVARGVDRGYVMVGDNVHNGLGVGPEIGLVGAGVAHIAAETHVVDLAVHVDNVVHPSGEPVGGSIGGLVVDV